MNPFETDKIFNAQLYESINKINKNSDKNILQGFTELLNMNDISLTSDNVMIRDALYKNFKSQNPEIKKLCSDLLYKIIKRDSNNLEEILAIWLIRFIEDHSYKTDLLIYKYIKSEGINNNLQGINNNLQVNKLEGININNNLGGININNNLEDINKLEGISKAVLKILDWGNDLLSSLKTFLFLLRNTSQDRREYFISKIRFLRFNSNTVLKYYYAIFKFIGPVEEIYRDIVNIQVPSLLNSKWKLLIDFYKLIPSCINKDAEYLEVSLLEKIVKDIDNIENIRVRNISSFRLVLPYCKDKFLFYRNNKNRLDKSEVCIFSIIEDFRVIDENFEDAGEIADYTIKRHGLTKLEGNLEDLRNIKDLSNIKNLNNTGDLSNTNDLRNIEDLRNIKKHGLTKLKSISKDVSLCGDCNKSPSELLRNLIKSLNNLPDDKKIYRAFKLGLTLNPDEFDIKVIYDSPHSVEVFPKEIFTDLKDKTSLLCKYPEDYSEEEVLSFIRWDNVFRLSQIPNYIPTVKYWLSTKEKEEMALHINNIPSFSKEFDLLFYCKGLTNILRYIEYEECPLQYLEIISKTEIFNQGDLNRVIINKLREVDIPVTTEFNDEYYSDIPYFYQNIQIRSTNKEIEDIRSFYRNRLLTNLEKMIFLICGVILNQESGSVVVDEIVHLDLKKNNYFLYKVYRDMGFEVEEPFKRNKELISLLENNVDRTILLETKDIKLDRKDINSIEIDINKIEIHNNIIETDNNIIKTKDFKDLKCKDSIKDIETDIKDIKTNNNKIETDNNIIKTNNNKIETDNNIIKTNNNIIKTDIKFIDNENPKVQDCKLLRGFIPKIQDTTLLSEKSLEIFVNYLKEDFEVYKCLDFLENDLSLPGNLRRLRIYSPILELITSYFKDSIINNFSLSQLEYSVDETELFRFLLSGIPERPDLFRVILIDTLMKIRNLNLIFFMEKMISKDLFLESSTEYQAKLAFLFPALYRKYIKKANLDILPLLIKESECNILDVESKAINRSTGLQINIKYQLIDNEFDCEIMIPNSYPLRPPSFITNVEKKSLLNLKISEMLGRTGKFMEVVSLWKINVDQKSREVQECYICYFILHIQDGSFPKYVCLHCENKFHTKCIDKWILGYKKSNCPLCRKPLPLY